MEKTIKIHGDLLDIAKRGKDYKVWDGYKIFWWRGKPRNTEDDIKVKINKQKIDENIYINAYEGKKRRTSKSRNE